MATPAAPAALVRATYKALLREAAQLTRAHDLLSLVRPVDPRAWGAGGFTAVEPPAALQAALFPGVSFAAAGLAGSGVLSGESVRTLVRSEFRRGGGGGVDAALRHLVTLNRLRASDACTTQTRTRFGDDVIVDVTLSTAFVSIMTAADMAAGACFPFAYRCVVRNSGIHAVQLLGRSWQFYDSGHELVVEVPRGSLGVVGHSPVLQPGQVFTYVSGTQHPTPRGSMAGSFQMVVLPAGASGDDPSEHFDAVIASTPLCGPAGLDDTLRPAQRVEPRSGTDAAHKDQ